MYGLCSVHCVRNKTKKKTAYAAVRNFCRSASMEERRQKLAILLKHHDNIYDHIIKCEADIGWLHMHLTKKLQCSFGITNTNGSEVTNNRVVELRALLFSLSLEKFTLRQKEDFSLGYKLACAYASKGNLLIIPYIVDIS